MAVKAIMRMRLGIALGTLAAVILALLLASSSPPTTTLTYKHKSLDAWFYGSRTNFFQERTRRAAQEAFDALGTNACPFLLSKLRTARGSGPLYFKLYRSLPAWAQTRLPTAISGDDIKAIALDHLRRMNAMSADQVQTLADCIPELRNPRLRMSGLEVMLMKHQNHPAFLRLCRGLLDDKHPGIQLEAAVWLGQSALAADPAEPRLFPLLIAAFESQEGRKARLDVSSYTYQQWPPGSPRPRPLPFPSPAFVVPPDQALRDRIKKALDRLERYLTPEQKQRFRGAEQVEKDQARIGLSI